MISARARRVHALRAREPVLLALALSAALVLAACTAETAPEPTASAEDDLPIAWTQLGPDGQVSARLIVASDSCPSLRVERRAGSDADADADADAELAMTVRAPAQPPDFPNTVCEADLAEDVSEAGVAGQRLALPARRAERVVAFGDTGCRIVDDRPPQACNDPEAWPFAQIAESSTELEPDLVLHLGDILARQDPCPAGDSGCAGSPFGSNFEAISADFFSPARPLLGVAPWVFVRGSEERCKANGPGWLRYFAPGPVRETCSDFTNPYRVPIGNANLVVFDSSIASNTKAPDDQIEVYGRQFARVDDLAKAHTWFLTHKPMWGLVTVEAGGDKRLVTDTRALQVASDNSLPGTVDFVASGQIRLFEMLEFAGGRVPQVIAGIGGTELDLPFEESPVGETIAGQEITKARTRRAHGLVVLDSDDGTWTLSFADVGGARLFSCPFEGGSFACL